MAFNFKVEQVTPGTQRKYPDFMFRQNGGAFTPTDFAKHFESQFKDQLFEVSTVKHLELDNETMVVTMKVLEMISPVQAAEATSTLIFQLTRV